MSDQKGLTQEDYIKIYGGAAFPHVIGRNSLWSGMSLQDWFAGQALAGLRINDYSCYDDAETSMAEHAYMIANAMIAEMVKEREKINNG